MAGEYALLASVCCGTCRVRGDGRGLPAALADRGFAWETGGCGVGGPEGFNGRGVV